MTGRVSDALVAAITKSLRGQGREFHWETFFPAWFREKGTPCFFLFKRNLGVTNAQYVELFSLLETYCIDVQTNQPKRHLLFHTTEQMRLTVTDTVNILLDVPRDQRVAQIRKFSEAYQEVYASTIAVDMFYCSCAVFLPPGTSLDIEQVCADSGYIHSAGVSIHIRNIRKSKKQDLLNSLDSHFQRFATDNYPVPFVVYAHEDFTGYDVDAREEIHRGIDGTKLYVEKMSMGSYRLAEIVQEMRTTLKGRLEIPEPGPYTLEHKFSNGRTIWLIGDRSVAPINPMNPGGDRYYICYQQYAKNDDPFFFFDENKPAWKSHTTLPHSLTAALLNATRPHMSGSQICDPFGGTGTTWLEAKRIGLTARVRCSDLSPISKVLVQDNLQFFLMDKARLLDHYHQLKDILDSVKAERRGSGVSDAGQRELGLDTPNQDKIKTASYSYAVRLLNELKHEQPNEDQEFRFTQGFVQKLSNLDFSTRLLFYIVLRAELRYQGGYKRRATTFDRAFERSLEELLFQTEKLLDVRRHIDDGASKECGTFLMYQGTYSSVVVSSLLKRTLESMRGALDSEVEIRNACELQSESVDIILCDPPYGFNTTEDRNALAELYSKFLDAALRALRDHGHLIICLPAESYTGRDLPYCTHAKLISNQVLIKAHNLKRHVYLPGRSLPHRMLIPPYYWEAERALRRTILHFRVSKDDA